ncbi:MAG TPA: hypothetical protein VGJ66_09075 [Pyrinomonadaceae bacterium]|jgi:hypothetical protein
MNASGENKDAAEDALNQISRALQDNLPEVDRLRATALEDLHLLRSARAEGLLSEQERLTGKLGADDPRVAEIALRRADNDELISGLAVESERARVAVPEVDKETWVLHGFVRDQQLRGVAGVTVALYDASGNWMQQLGYAGTSANGYFRLEARSLANLKPPLFVHVLTSQAAHLHTDNVPLTPELGSVLYHEIVVSGAQTGTPPGDSRNDPVAEPGAWIVRGRVTDKEGKGLSDLVVSLYDKDLFFDDKLGQTETDDSGDFSLIYRTEDFRDLIERKPDIYVKVLDQKGKTLYTLKNKLRYEAGRVEIVNVQIGDQGKK